MIRSYLKKIQFYLNRQKFDNKEFWNKRYENNPSKGSGPGSRGTILSQKKAIISLIINKYNIQSIIDYGCGDIEAVRHLNCKNYTGVDISEVVIEKNKLIRPDWNFSCGSIQESSVVGEFDLVICFDVLIHQKYREDYFSILEKLLNNNNSIVVLSGYEEPPDGWNVFFHEPLSSSLKKMDVGRKFTKIYEYRDTVMFSSIEIKLPLQ